MKHSEIFEGVIDATDLFQRRKDKINAGKKSVELAKNAQLNDANIQIQKVIDEKLREAKNWLRTEMSKYRFITASFKDAIDKSPAVALFFPLYDKNHVDYDRSKSAIIRYRKDLLAIIEGYIDHLKTVMGDARSKAEELTGDWRDANNLLINSRINRLFDAATDLWQKIFHINETDNES